MQHSWKFPIHPDQHSSGQLDQEAISQILLSHKRELEILISHYTKADGALGEEPEITEFSDSGSLKISFNKAYYNACLNINETDKDNLRFEFKIDQQTSTLLLTGPDFGERGMDEL
ncbi:hypothetical protein GCM10007049_28070 [Echinicola pacifica]|uniref:Uncharacterized protein n=1 Tax=Echinicola pacifica TaxID=346377 RepID=A0A918Q3R7_9BACT|nr:hypothetical protein [Echinicola pacifica]GGZ32840.1 hypothetical protein GCM10007049_28070 [Echinicola pacifica]